MKERKERGRHVRRLLSTVLTLAMVLTALPMCSITAFAAGEESHTHNEITFDKVLSNSEINQETGDLPAGNYYLSDDLQLTKGIVVNSGTVNICLNGHVLKLVSSGVSLKSAAGATLGIYDCGTTSHKFKKSDSGLWVLDEEDGTITVNGGCITGGSNPSSDAPVYAVGTMILNSGTICGNVGKYAGGVSIDGTFTMNGGAISGNLATNGGGVYNNYTFTMNNGIISENIATSFAGGVFNGKNKQMTMNGGEISNNRATSHCGGVLNNTGAQFTMNNATISNNTSGGNGGGIYNGGSSTITINNSTISGNKAKIGGGMISFSNANITLKNGSKVIDNTASSNAGGMYCDEGTVNKIEDSTISGNTAADAGAIMCMSDLVTVIVGGTTQIKDNKNNLGNRNDYRGPAVFFGTGAEGNGVKTPADSMRIGFSTVLTGRTSDDINTYAFLKNATADDVKYFFADNAKYVVDYDATKHFVVRLERSITQPTNATKTFSINDKSGYEAEGAITYQWFEKELTNVDLEGKYTLTTADTANSTADVWKPKYASERYEYNLYVRFTAGNELFFECNQPLSNSNIATNYGHLISLGDNKYKFTFTNLDSRNFMVTVKNNDFAITNLSLYDSNDVEVTGQTSNTLKPTKGGVYYCLANFVVEGFTNDTMQSDDIVLPPHTHNWIYSANGNKLEAYCSAAGCYQDYTDSDHTVSLELSATNQDYTGSAYAGTGMDSTAWEAIGFTVPTIKYVGRGTTSYSESETAPTNAGSYTAKIAFGEYIASKDFDIAKLTPTYTVPSGLTAKEGSSLSDVTLPDGFSWQDAGTTSVGEAGNNTFKVKYTPSDTENYAVVSNIEVVIAVSPNENSNKPADNGSNAGGNTPANNGSSTTENKPADNTSNTDSDKTIDTSSKVDPKAPVESAAISNSQAELLQAPGIFTAAEREAIKNGAKAKVYFDIKNLEVTNIPKADLEQIDNAATKLLGNDMTIRFMDISLFKQVGNNAESKISSPGITMNVSVKLPSFMQPDKTGWTRVYRVLRLHEGAVDTLLARYNSETGELSFDTDRCSTYAIAYSDVKTEIQVKNVSDKASLTKKGETLQLEVTVTPAEDAKQAVTYKSSDEKVVTVDTNGKLTAVGNGEATITITTADGSVSKEIKCTVSFDENNDKNASDSNVGKSNNTTIILIIVILVICGAAALVIFKKKKK